MDIYAPPYWLASPDKLPPETTEMTVTFDNPMHTEQKEKIEKPEKINNRKTEEKENESHHQYVQKMIKTSNTFFTASSNNKAVPEITNTQSKYPPVFCGQMRPDLSISHHPAFSMLHKYATKGCPVDCSKPWTMEHLEAAIHRGPHILARSSQAAACLREEALEKVKQGYAEIVNWDDIRKITI